MISLSHSADLFANNGDLTETKVTPAEILDRPELCALFFFRAMAPVGGLQPRLYAEIATKCPAFDTDAIKDLVRRCFASRFPAFGKALFSSAVEHDPQAIEDALRRVWNWASNIQKDEDVGSAQAKAKAWAVCCRGAGLNAGPGAQDWLEGFASDISAGRSARNPSANEDFALAIRWGLAAMPDDWPVLLPGSNDGLQCVKIQHPAKDEFLKKWAEGLDKAVAWRGATWLAATKGPIWRHLIEAVVGVRLNDPIKPPPPNLDAPHGADHLVALVGGKSSGKTALLCSLATNTTDAQPFRFQCPDDARSDWIDVDRQTSPIYTEWLKGDPLGTAPGENFNYRGVTTPQSAVRLIIHDVAGETFADQHRIASFHKFIREFGPSAMILLAGDQSRAQSEEIANQNAEAARAAEQAFGLLATICGEREKKLPVFVLFNFSDHRFDANDCRRDSLLGGSDKPDKTDKPFWLDVNCLGDSAPQTYKELCDAIGSSRVWAEHPAEALAFEQAIASFGGAISKLLPTFPHLTLGFTCCAGNSDSQLRRSASKLWGELQTRVSKAARTSTPYKLYGEFNKRPADAVRALKSLRTLGRRLGALRPPNVRINDTEREQLKEDWNALRQDKLKLKALDDDLEAFVNSLPGAAADWASLPGKEEDFADRIGHHNKLFAWLLASLAIPHDQHVPTVQESAPDGQGAAAAEPPPPNTWTLNGWSSPLAFSCRWNEGAASIPSEWRNGAGKATAQSVCATMSLSGPTFAEMLVECLKKSDLNTITKVVRALTHFHEDEKRIWGFFKEQWMMPGRADVYAYAALNNDAKRFKRCLSVAKCQVLISEMFKLAAKFGFKQVPGAAETGVTPQADDREKSPAIEATIRVPLSDADREVLQGQLKIAWRLRLLRECGTRSASGGGGALTPEDLDLRWYEKHRLKTRDFELNLKKELQLQHGLNSREVSRWVSMTRSSTEYPEYEVLMAVADFGEKLVKMVDERLAGFLHAKILYALKTEWFHGQSGPLWSLKTLLEQLDQDAWQVYEGPLLGGTMSYSALFGIAAPPPPQG